jgi:hypothetical protein
LDNIITTELERAKESIESATVIWDRVARCAREKRKQFIRKIRRIRRDMDTRSVEEKFLFAPESAKTISGQPFMRQVTSFVDQYGKKQ